MGAVISFGITSFLNRPCSIVEQARFLKAFAANNTTCLFHELVFYPAQQGEEVVEVMIQAEGKSVTLKNTQIVPSEAKLEAWEDRPSGISYVDWTSFGGIDIHVPGIHAMRPKQVKLPGIEHTLWAQSTEVTLRSLTNQRKEEPDNELWGVLLKLFRNALSNNWILVIQ